MCRKDGQDDGMSSFEGFTMLWVVQKSGMLRKYMGYRVGHDLLYACGEYERLKSVLGDHPDELFRIYEEGRSLG